MSTERLEALLLRSRIDDALYLLDCVKRHLRRVPLGGIGYLGAINFHHASDRLDTLKIALEMLREEVDGGKAAEG